MGNEPSNQNYTFRDMIVVSVLSVIIISIVTGAVGTISIFTLSFLGLNHVFDITLAIQSLSVAYLIYAFIDWSLKEHRDTHHGSSIWRNVKGIGLDAHDFDDFDEVRFDEHTSDHHLESTIIDVLGLLTIIGLAIYSAIIGYIKGLTLSGFFTGLLGGILGLGVGIGIGLLTNFIINKGFLYLFLVLTSIPLGTYLRTFEVIGRDEIVTVMITSYVWGFFILLFSIFLFIVYLLPTNRFSTAIHDILHHGR